MKDKTKKIICIVVCIIIIIIAITCFVVAMQKSKIKVASKTIDTIETQGKSASEISSEFGTTNYSSIQELEAGKVIDITSGGSYTLSGEYNSITINTTTDVILNLVDATIINTNGPAINVEDAEKVSIILSGVNKIKATTTEELDGAIYSKDDLIFSGDGSLEIESNYDGIVSKDSLIINSGNYIIQAEDDGIRGKDNVAIVDGTFKITSGGDGIKSTNDSDTNKGYIVIDGGVFDIIATTDGIQAETYLNINGGTFNIQTGGGYTNSNVENSAKGLKAETQIAIQGGEINLNSADDAIHSNGDIVFSGGTLTLQTGDDGAHADATLQVIGGTITINNCYEGLEGSIVDIKGGNITVNASDDGINAASKDNTEEEIDNRRRDNFRNSSNSKLYISGGVIKVLAAADGLDANGTIDITGGEIYVESSNNNAETALDHDGTLTISGGTLIAVSKSSGANDIGTKTSTIPMGVVNITSGSGTISIGSLSYTPSISNYSQIIIASSELSNGEITLTYGSETTSVTLSTGDFNTSGFGNGMMRDGRENDMDMREKRDFDNFNPEDFNPENFNPEDFNPGDFNPDERPPKDMKQRDNFPDGMNSGEQGPMKNR